MQHSHSSSFSSPGMSEATSLSPRLQHLLIQEDRTTGRLQRPTGRRLSADHDQSNILGASLQPSTSRGSHTSHASHGSRRSTVLLSPPVSPTNVFAFAPSPTEKPIPLPTGASAPRLLPPPTGRPTSSIFSLLNDAPSSAQPLASSRSPPSSVSSARSAPYTRRPVSEEQRQSPPFSQVAPPHTAPLPSHPHDRGEYFDQHIRERYPASLALSPGSRHSVSRPSFFRRHSSHPYGYDGPSRPMTAYPQTSSEGEYVPTAGLVAMGARAPISRTTKACNPCRNRKVRCDAGGGGPEPSQCSRCRESNVACTYSGQQKKRGPCPGTARPATSAKVRKPSIQQPPQPMSLPQPPSHRSSIASVQSYVLTPTDEQPWPPQGGYGFPLPTPASTISEWSSIAPGKGAARPLTSGPLSPHSIELGQAGHSAILPWPHMDAPEVGSPPHSAFSSTSMYGSSFGGQRKPMSAFDHRDYVGQVERSPSGHNGPSFSHVENGRPEGGLASRRSMVDNSRTLPPLRVAIDRRAGSYYESS